MESSFELFEAQIKQEANDDTSLFGSDYMVSARNERRGDFDTLKWTCSGTATSFPVFILSQSNRFRRHVNRSKPLAQALKAFLW